MRRARKNASWSIAIYIAVLLAGAHTAVPFFTPYMLQELGMDYATYAALTCVPIAVRAITSPLLFSASRRVGMRVIFMLGTGLIAVVALIWAMFSSLEALVCAQALSGVAWGMFEYASYQLLLQSGPADSRVEFLSLANALSGAAQLAGALVGGVLLLNDTLDYRSVFLLSASARALPALFAARIIPTRLPVLPRLFFRIISVRPSGGAVQRPIVAPTVSEAEAEAEKKRMV